MLWLFYPLPCLQRAYNLSLPHNKIPQDLSDLAGKLAKPAMNESHFHAEAAIVNYFGYGKGYLKLALLLAVIWIIELHRSEAPGKKFQ